VTPRRRILVSSSSEARANPYLEALREGGAEAFELHVVTPEVSPVTAETLAADSAGLVLCGGLDVAPERYREAPLPQANVESSPDRDAVEWALLAGARAGRVPTFAVCRGLQVVNVFLGGTLWQDLPLQLRGAIDHDQREPRDLLAHTVTRRRVDHPWAELLGEAPVPVNTRHHQGVRRLAAELMALVDDDDGLIEAAALPADSGWWLAGVQWHPENLLGLERQLALWRGFTRVAAGGEVAP
jgi:putative glutamine amidotransferase